MLQKCRDQRKDVVAIFLDNEKAFDEVKYDKLVHMLQEVRLDDRDVRIVQVADVRVEQETSNEVQLRKGDR